MRGAVCISAALFLGACATGPGADDGIAASRYTLFEGERFGYFDYEAGNGAFGITDNWRPAEAVITIVSREGRPVTEADRDIAARLARQICEEGGREFNTRSRGSLLRRGGISFAGDCREW